jgi:hypothetical protein
MLPPKEWGLHSAVQKRKKGEVLMKRRIALLIVAVMVALGVTAAPSLAGGYYPPPPKHPSNSNCNAGNGNGNEFCDPGNSAPQNKGGDEIGCPVVFGGSTPNPGDNNVFCPDS